jgi:hypothetical protein
MSEKSCSSSAGAAVRAPIRLLRGHFWRLAIAATISARLGLMQTFFLHIGRRTEVLLASEDLAAAFGARGIIEG